MERFYFLERYLPVSASMPDSAVVEFFLQKPN